MPVTTMIKMKQGKKRISFSQNRELVLLIILIAFSIIVQVRNTQYLSLLNISDMLVDTAVLIIISCGMLMVMLTGGIDLSVASIMAVSGMSTAMIMSSNPGIPPVIIILLGVMIGTALGLLNGLIIGKGKVIPIIATMGTMNVYRGITYLVANGEQITASEMTEGFKKIATGKLLGINTLIFITIVVAIIIYFFLSRYRLGRRIYAVGSNSESAKISGTNISNVLVFVYMVMGLLCGLCGVLYVSRYSVAQADMASGTEMYAIAACVLGGVNISGGSGKLQGVLLGAILIGFINNALPMLLISSFWKQAIQGVIILAAILINVIILRRSDRMLKKGRI